MAELARRLIADNGLAATLVTFAADLSAPDAHAAALSSLRDAGVATAALPAVPLDDVPADAHIETVLFELIRRSAPHLHALLRDVSSAAPLAALVPDFFSAVLLSLAAEVGILGYIFFPSNLTALALMRSALELNEGAAPVPSPRRSPPTPVAGTCLPAPTPLSTRRRARRPCVRPPCAGDCLPAPAPLSTRRWARRPSARPPGAGACLSASLPRRSPRADAVSNCTTAQALINLPID